jgi:hypothetical protein
MRIQNKRRKKQLPKNQKTILKTVDARADVCEIRGDSDFNLSCALSVT